MYCCEAVKAAASCQPDSASQKAVCLHATFSTFSVRSRLARLGRLGHPSPSKFIFTMAASSSAHSVPFQVESENVTYTDESIHAKYSYDYTKVTRNEDGSCVVKPGKRTYEFLTKRDVPKTGVLLVGLGGNNGSTMVGGIIANREYVTHTHTYTCTRHHTLSTLLLHRCVQRGNGTLAHTRGPPFATSKLLPDKKSYHAVEWDDDDDALGKTIRSGRGEEGVEERRRKRGGGREVWWGRRREGGGEGGVEERGGGKRVEEREGGGERESEEGGCVCV